MPTQKFIFISYSYQDAEWAGEISRALARHNIKVWLAEDQLEVAQDLVASRSSLRRAMRESSGVVFILTPNTVNSTWMAAELGGALALQKPIFPVLVGDVSEDDIPAPLRQRLHRRVHENMLSDENQLRSLAEEIAEAFDDDVAMTHEASS